MNTSTPTEPPPPNPATALSPLGQMFDGLCPSRPMMSEDERQLVTDELFWESGELRAHLARFFVRIVLLTR